MRELVIFPSIRRLLKVASRKVVVINLDPANDFLPYRVLLCTVARSTLDELLTREIQMRHRHFGSGACGSRSGEDESGSQRR